MVRMENIDVEKSRWMKRRQDISDFSGTPFDEFPDDSLISSKPVIGSSILDVIDDIIGGKEIADKIAQGDYIFSTEKDPTVSERLAKAFSVIAQKAKSVYAKKGAAITNEKSSIKADEYAVKIHKVVKDIESEKGRLSYQATVDWLNEKGVKTPGSGKKWHVNTLQNLKKRWKELGLD